MRLSQRQIYHRLSNHDPSYLNIMKNIAEFLKISVVSYERTRSNDKIEIGYSLSAKSLTSRLRLINYLEFNPLQSSKKLDYEDWLKAHNLVINKLYKTEKGTLQLTSLKDEINNQRKVFNWSHLHNNNISPK